MPQALNKDNFEKEVLQSDVPVMVDFWAPWCGPCKLLGPIVEELVKEYEGKQVKIVKVNVDENPELSEKYEVMSIPTILFFKAGKPEKSFIGLQDKKTLQDALNAYV